MEPEEAAEALHEAVKQYLEALINEGNGEVNESDLTWRVSATATEAAAEYFAFLDF